jgi:hypothetical protein
MTNASLVGPSAGGADRAGWNLDAEKIACPVRIVWGSADKILAFA